MRDDPTSVIGRYDILHCRLSRVKVSGTCVQPFQRYWGFGVFWSFGLFGVFGGFGVFWDFGVFGVLGCFGVLGFWGF